MDAEGLGGHFLVAVEELGIPGLWTTFKDVRQPHRQFAVPASLHCAFVDSCWC